MSEHKHDIFVGYLPVPQRFKRFLKKAVPTLMVVVVGAGVVLAAMQQNPGKTSGWDPDPQNPIELRGFLIMEPYPMLRYLENGTMRTAPVDFTGKNRSQTTRRECWARTCAYARGAN